MVVKKGKNVSETPRGTKINVEVLKAINVKAPEKTDQKGETRSRFKLNHYQDVTFIAYDSYNNFAFVANV